MLWILTMITYGLIDAGTCLSLGFAGIVLGTGIMTIWMIGCIRGSHVYRKGAPPGWMTWFADDPPGSRFHRLRQPETWKVISMVIMLVWLAFPMYDVIVEDSHADSCLIITSIASWVVGILLVELHFRRNYYGNVP
jgi:fucose 4-O-acetylase-like acetyltransferase